MIMYVYIVDEVFQMFEPLIGTKCIQYANGAEGRARRKAYDKCLTADSIHKYFGLFQEVCVVIWNRLQLPLYIYQYLTNTHDL